MPENITKYIIINLIFGFVILKFAPNISGAYKYPVKELESCRDAKECRLYCSIPASTPACWSYNRYGVQNNNILGENIVDSTAAAKQKGITFPVADLGKCTSVTSCREFCRQTANWKACTDFALKKKLIASSSKTISSTVLSSARKELGCRDAPSCRSYCSLPENKELCRSFGEKYSLAKKSASPTGFDARVWSDTKSELGCADELSCRNLCNHPDNRQKCRDFAQKHLADTRVTPRPSLLVTVTPGPGGCRTEKECFDYCHAHPDVCPLFPVKTSSFGKISNSPYEKE